MGGFDRGAIGGVEKFDPKRNLWTEVSDLLVAMAVERRRLEEAAQRT